MREENADNDGYLIWHDLDLTLTRLGLSLRSVWERKTLTGVCIGHDLNLAPTLSGLSLDSVWERKPLTVMHILIRERTKRRKRREKAERAGRDEREG